MSSLPSSSRSGRVPRVLTAVLLALALALGSLAFTAGPASAASKSKATNAEYKKIKNGQTLAQVRAIVDSNGTELRNGTYRWKSTQGRYVFVYFGSDGKVYGKLRLVVASLSEYKKIKKGNSYDRVKKVFGGPSQFSFQDNDVRYRVWYTPELDKWVTIKFDHGKVIGKSRSGDIFTAQAS